MPPQSDLPKNCEFIKGNLLDESVMDESMKGVQLVFHTASAGMSGTGQLDEDQFKINIFEIFNKLFTPPPPLTNG